MFTLHKLNFADLRLLFLGANFKVNFSECLRRNKFEYKSSVTKVDSSPVKWTLVELESVLSNMGPWRLCSSRGHVTWCDVTLMLFRFNLSYIQALTGRVDCSRVNPQNKTIRWANFMNPFYGEFPPFLHTCRDSSKRD